MIVCLVEDAMNFYYPHTSLNYINLPVIFITTFSLILGPIGIVSSSIGQLIYGIAFYIHSHFSNDIFNTYVLFYPLIVLVIGFFCYKLYHTLNFKNSRLIVYLNNTYNLLSLVVTILITNGCYLIIAYSVHINILMNKSAKFGFIEHYFSIIYVVLPVTILFISILSLLNIEGYIPKNSKITSKYLKPYTSIVNYYPKLINSFLLLLTIILIVMDVVYNNEIFTNNFYGTNTLLIVLFMIILIFLKPGTKNSIEKNSRSFFEVIYLIIILQFVVMALIIYFHINSLTQFTPLNTYLFYFANTNLYMLIMIVLINLIALYFTQFFLRKYITKPLNTLSEIMTNYTSNNKSTQPDPAIYINLKDTLNEFSTHNYEVASLARSFKNMIDALEEHIKEIRYFTSKNKKINADLLFASKIQEDIIPNIFPPFPDRLEEFDIYASYNPLEDVGGDLYDYFLIDDDHLAIIIGDVSGKGVPASLFMMRVITLIKNQLLMGLSPSESFNITNKRIYAENENKMFLSSWLGIIEISSGKLTYVNAGHNTPFISHDHSDYIDLPGQSVILGVDNSAEYIQHETTLKQAKLYLYTDGVTEALSKNNEQFSRDRLLDVLNKNKHTNIKELILKIKEELYEFTSSAEQFDDEAMMIVEYRRKH
ncbi:MAG: SpoIIE family protein phosphatase [Methanobrevibacter sp.]|nr:SpoIIE family protein phosphatase [Candidatus Methanovirga australis]